MVTRLSNYKIGDYALVLDLLGVAERMGRGRSCRGLLKIGTNKVDTISEMLWG
jgi:hypothetical protein